MNIAEIKSEFEKNDILASVLIALIGTNLLVIIFKFGIVIFVVMYFVIMAITYMGINLSEDD